MPVANAILKPERPIEPGVTAFLLPALPSIRNSLVSTQGR